MKTTSMPRFPVIRPRIDPSQLLPDGRHFSTFPMADCQAFGGLGAVSARHHMRPKRKHVLKACDWCRMKKTKCDGKQPCSRCVSHGRGCLYGHKKPANAKGSSKSSVTEGIEVQNELLAKTVMALYQIVVGNNPLPQSTGQTPGKPASIHEIMEQVGVIKEAQANAQAQALAQEQEQVASSSVEDGNDSGPGTPRTPSIERSTSMPSMDIDNLSLPGSSESDFSHRDSTITIGTTTTTNLTSPTSGMDISSRGTSFSAAPVSVTAGPAAAYSFEDLTRTFVDWQSCQPQSPLDPFAFDGNQVPALDPFFTGTTAPTCANATGTTAHPTDCQMHDATADVMAAAAAVPGFQKHCVPFDMTQLPGPMPSMPSTTLDLSMSPLSAHAHGQQAQSAWYPGL